MSEPLFPNFSVVHFSVKDPSVPISLPILPLLRLPDLVRFVKNQKRTFPFRPRQDVLRPRDVGGQSGLAPLQ